MTPIQAGVASTFIDVSFTVIACIARWTDTAITINQVLEKEKEGGETHADVSRCSQTQNVRGFNMAAAVLATRWHGHMLSFGVDPQF